MRRKGLLAFLFALLTALIIGQGASVTAQAVASITLPSPGTTKQLYEGCNNISLTFPDGTSSQLLVQAVAPAGVVESVWRHDAQARKWQGFAPASAAASDLLSVNFLDSVWLCVGALAGPAPTPTAPPALAPPATATPTPTPPPTATPTPTPSPVVPGYTAENVMIRTQTPGLPTVLEGEVKNHTGEYAVSVQVNATLFDGAGIVIASPPTWACPNMVKPYDTIAFGTYYSGTLSVASYEFSVQAMPIPPLPDASLSVSELEVQEDEQGRAHVLGLITNTGGERYEHVLVCAAFYDSSAQVVGLILDYAPDVAPGQTASFDAWSNPYGGLPSSDAVTYRLWIHPTGGTSYRDTGYVSTGVLPVP